MDVTGVVGVSVTADGTDVNAGYRTLLSVKSETVVDMAPVLIKSVSVIMASQVLTVVKVK